MLDLEHTPNEATTPRVGLVLLNMGGPKSIEDIRPFLYNLFADPDIINLPFFLKPFQKPLAWLIAKFRTPGTTEMYSEIGNGSPILGITEDLGEKIAGQFSEEYNCIPVVAMRYTPPRAIEAVKYLKSIDVDKIVLFSQYPHYADSTSGSSIRDFYEAMEEVGYSHDDIAVIDEWGLEDGYINWWVRNIASVFDENEISLDKDTHLIFSAHGLPKRYVDNGEQYPERIREAASRIMEELGDLSKSVTCHVSFQSQAGPVEWTKPYTDELLEEISEKEGQKVVIVPLGFVSNHVETLYEIDILYKDQAVSDGISEYYRVEVPDADEDYAKDMAEMIERRM